MSEPRSKCKAPDAEPDFLFLNCSLSQPQILDIAPASYIRTLLHLRWATQSTAIMGQECLCPYESRDLTLHSMKTTMLAAAAQLALPREDRLAQGHHRDSARLYSQIDTYDSLRVQRRLATQLAHGWRPNRSMARGGGAPVPEPPFSVSSTAPIEHLPTMDLHGGVLGTLHFSPHCPHPPLPPYRPTQTAKQKPSRHTPMCTETRVKRKHSTLTDNLNVSSLSATGRGLAATEPQRTRKRSIGPVSLLRLHSSARAAAPSSE